MEQAEVKIDDYWNGSPLDNRELSESWTGLTKFQLIQPPVGAGYLKLPGRDLPVRIMDSTKPEEVYPETLGTYVSKSNGCCYCSMGDRQATS